MDELDGQMGMPERVDKTPPGWSAKTMLTIAIVILIVFAIIIASLFATNVLQLGGGVTMRELQDNYVDAEHGYKHYNARDTVVLVDTVLDVELYEMWIRDYTIVTFSINELPSPSDIDEGRVQVEPWFTYYPEHGETATSFYGMGEIRIEGDVRENIHVGDKIKLTLHFKEMEIPARPWQAPYSNEPYVVEYIDESGPQSRIMSFGEIEIIR